MNFDYQWLLEIYQAMLSDQAIFVVITGLKVVGVVMVVIVWYGRYLNALKDPENFSMPVKPKDWVTGLGTIVLISMYTELLNWFDYFWSFAENFYAGFQVQPKDLGLTTTPEVGEDYAKDWTDTIKDAGYAIIKMIRDPTYSVVAVSRGLAWFIDLMIFGIFIAERFFYLGILRIFGGIALAFSYHPKLSKWFWNWFGLYVGIYLLIIPYFLVNAFTNVIYEKAELAIDSVGGAAIPGMYSPLIIVVFFIIWLKFKLYKGSREIVYKIFN